MASDSRAETEKKELHKHTKAIINMHLKTLTLDERLEVFAEFCAFCGRAFDELQENRCYCMRVDDA